MIVYSNKHQQFLCNKSQQIGANLDCQIKYNAQTYHNTQIKHELGSELKQITYARFAQILGNPVFIPTFKCNTKLGLKYETFGSRIELAQGTTVPKELIPFTNNK